MTCDRCHRKPPAGFQLVPFGHHSGEITHYCPSCASLQEHLKKGCPLPRNRLFTESQQLLKRASNALEARYSSNPPMPLPEALQNLRAQTNRIRSDLGLDPVGMYSEEDVLRTKKKLAAKLPEPRTAPVELPTGGELSAPSRAPA